MIQKDDERDVDFQKKYLVYFIYTMIMFEKYINLILKKLIPFIKLF